MSTSLRKQIYENMDRRETEELLEIWQTNDRVEWSDEAFEAIREVLQNRGIEPPPQNGPVLTHEDEEKAETEGLTEQELIIIDDEDPPEFYDPFQVLKFSKWLNIAAIVSIGISVALSLVELPRTRSIALSYTLGTANDETIALGITFLILAVGFALQVLMTYFPLKALAHILRVLMQMEYNSRKSVSAQPAAEN